jgi:hypothetical protein
VFPQGTQAGGGSAGLFRVPETGGQPETLLGAKTGTVYRWPHFLPGGQILFTASRGIASGDAEIRVFDATAGGSSVLVEGGIHAQYAASGHLVFGRNGALLAVPFDPKRLSVDGPPIPVLDGVKEKVNDTIDFSLSRDGSLAYITDGEGMDDHRVFEGRASRNLARWPLACLFDQHLRASRGLCAELSRRRPGQVADIGRGRTRTGVVQ